MSCNHQWKKQGGAHQLHTDNHKSKGKRSVVRYPVYWLCAVCGLTQSESPNKPNKK
jgi:hypothetical protein